jgi:hypothetical protein
MRIYITQITYLTIQDLENEQETANINFIGCANVIDGFVSTIM